DSILSGVEPPRKPVRFKATTGRLSSISRRDAYCQKVPVIHIKRNYSKLALPDFPSTTVEREILQAALLEAMEYLNAGT
ncbi:hypothetical protein, partial [Comamonas thiooxydans]|uniref:hypothetical protein n=1 Tax=Comamonas thiooxydans TaxID=363952 RepID=UPI001A947430